jgi:transposase
MKRAGQVSGRLVSTVDYAGATVPIHNPESGQVWEAAIFVAVLGASNYTYAEASLTQGLPVRFNASAF